MGGGIPGMAGTSFASFVHTTSATNIASLSARQLAKSTPISYAKRSLANFNWGLTDDNPRRWEPARIQPGKSVRRKTSTHAQAKVTIARWEQATGGISGTS